MQFQTFNMIIYFQIFIELKKNLYIQYVGIGV